MTRKDFEVFAALVKELPVKDRSEVAKLIAKGCAQINPNFKPNVFYRAAGVKNEA